MMGGVFDRRCPHCRLSPRPTTAPTVVPYAGYSPHSQSKGNPKRALVVGMSALGKCLVQWS
jgi:hypothetical protein